jgi:hypothetical protein
VYRRVQFQHVRERLHPGRDDSWGRRIIRDKRTEIQDLESRMCLERITHGVPRFVAQQCVTKIQVNKAFVFSEGTSDCKDFLVSDFEGVGNVRFEALQTTVSAQPISENDIVDITTIKLGRSLIATKDLCQSTCSSTRKFTSDQYDLEIWPGMDAKHTAVTFIQF